MTRLPRTFFIGLALYAVTGFCYSLVPFCWHRLSSYSITGDEPHYLMIAESLYGDHDLDVRNNYASDSAQAKYYSGLTPEGHCLEHRGGLYSIHGIGVPLLIGAPAYFFGGLGGRIAMALLNAMIAPLLFALIERHFLKRSLAIAATLTIAMGMPFLSGANQLFPDMLAGTLSLLCIVLADNIRSGGRAFLAIPYIAVASFFPWLHLKYALVSPLFAMYGFLFFPISWRRQIVISAAYLLVAISSLVFFVGINLHCYGTFTGPYSQIGDGHIGTQFLPAKNLAVGLAFFFDQAHGMLVQQPLLWVCFIGLGSLAVASKSRALLLVSIYAALVGPNAFHPVWFGAWSFVGRFAWSGLGALIAFFAAGLPDVVRLIGQTRFAALLALSCGYQAWIASYWFRNGYLLQRDQHLPPWLFNSIAPELVGMVPSLYESTPGGFDIKLLGYIGSAVALVIVGLRASKIGPIHSQTLSYAAVAGFLLIATLPENANETREIYVKGADFQAIVGDVRGGARVTEAHTPPGYMTYGPYFRLPAGSYQLDFEYSTDVIGSEPSIDPPKWDIFFHGGKHAVLLGGPLEWTQGAFRRMTQSFTVDSRHAFEPVEFRVWHTAGATVTLYGCNLRKL